MTARVVSSLAHVHTHGDDPVVSEVDPGHRARRDLCALSRISSGVSSRNDAGNVSATSR